MAEAIRSLGPDAGLQLRVQWLPVSVRHQRGLAWAAFSVCVAGHPVWGEARRAGDSRLEWTLVDLLHGLARTWVWLMHEEGYPLPLARMPDHPGRLMDLAAARWEELPESTAEAEEDALFDFRQRHDLSTLFRGLVLPPLWVLREGRDCQVWSPVLREPVLRPYAEVAAALGSWGDEIASVLEADGSEHPRAQLAVEAWRQRQSVAGRKFLEVVTGLEPQALVSLLGSAANDEAHIADFFELDAAAQAQPEPNELLMAARMTRGLLGNDAQRDLLSAIRDVPASCRGTLDALSSQAPAPDPDEAPWQQGYRLAQWLREELSHPLERKVDPAAVLANWGVQVLRVRIRGPIDAAAIWGPRHGPAILLNGTALSKASTANGRRTALAHEICHLLIDREGALPVAEVLGGQVVKRVEQRANAFAAEWLLPRSVAAASLRGSRDIIACADALQKRYLVSRELVCRQIGNSELGPTLSKQDHDRLQAWQLNGGGTVHRPAQPA